MAETARKVFTDSRTDKAAAARAFCGGVGALFPIDSSSSQTAKASDTTSRAFSSKACISFSMSPPHYLKLHFSGVFFCHGQQIAQIFAQHVRHALGVCYEYALRLAGIGGLAAYG